MKLSLKNVRIAFAVLFEAKTVNGEGEPAFSASLLLDPVTHKATIAEIEAAIDAVGQEKWGAKWGAVQKSSAFKGVCLQDGDGKADYAGFEGQMYVSTRSKTRPLVIDRDKTPLTEKDGRPYGGCFVNASIELWAQDNKFGKRINAQLKGVQFYRDGDAFSGGAPASADEFDDLAVEDELA